MCDTVMARQVLGRNEMLCDQRAIFSSVITIEGSAADGNGDAHESLSFFFCEEARM